MISVEVADVETWAKMSLIWQRHCFAPAEGRFAGKKEEVEEAGLEGGWWGMKALVVLFKFFRTSLWFDCPSLMTPVTSADEMAYRSPSG